MILSKKVQGKKFHFGAATTCAVLLLIFLVFVVSTERAAGEPKTVAEVALYQGPDRQKILIEGAKREGQLTLYTSHTWFGTVAQEFEKKYPFIKVSAWRSDSTELIKRVVEEYAAGRFFVDALEVTDATIFILHNQGFLQEYYSPETRYYGEPLKGIGKIGVYYCADRETYIVLGFNTKLIPPHEAPKTLKDLLAAKWKGKMSITNTSTGVQWIGNALEAMGRNFIQELSRLDVKIHGLAPVALANLVATGEVPLSPTLIDSNVSVLKKKGAPVEWRPVEPVLTRNGYSAIATKTSHPHAALLFLDYLHSKEGQKVVMQGGLWSPREDIGSVEQNFKKAYLQIKSVEEYDKKFNEWTSLLDQLFMKKR